MGAEEEENTERAQKLDEEKLVRITINKSPMGRRCTGRPRKRWATTSSLTIVRHKNEEEIGNMPTEKENPRRTFTLAIKS